VVLAEAGALAAVVAPILKDSRDEQLHREYLVYLGLQEYVNVGLFNVAVNDLGFS
jgi:hypothetical protein